ncbi:MAG: transglutaminase family protein [Rhodoferax sp.]|nr:transglutaminase family protein [Rhodoferax sp.]
MSIHVALHHVTTYEYDRLVRLGPQVIRLRPAPHSRSRILSYSLRVEPGDHFINWQQDPYANYQARLVFPQPTRRLQVTVGVVAEMAVHNPFDFFLEPGAERFPFEYEPLLQHELAPYRVEEPAGAWLTPYLAGVDRRERATIDFLVDLNRRVHQDIAYLIRMEPGVQAPDTTLRLRSGSCRDSAWLMVQLLRHCGLAARFVSGYLIQLKADVRSLDGPSGTEADFTDLHAWCEVYLPGAGWIGLDATSGLLAGEGHIPLACTPQPSGAAPIEGAVDESEVVFSHDMRVSRIHESPRVTLPYSEAQWERVMTLGAAVDQRLAQDDVRLTMGGEPTFVAIDDRDAPEWNTEALGPAKRGFATELVHRLRTEYGHGGFLHFGQGKWYPGEQLPRWALGIYWRTDGQPVWRDPDRFADERQPNRYTTGDAGRFIQALARRLGLDPAFVMDAYEDIFYYLWRERRLPVNVDPLNSRLDDEMERARLRRVYQQGLGRVVGYALPLEASDPPGRGPAWRTGPWFLRDERLYLMPGDSPMGYRLPLDALPWAHPDDSPPPVPRDPADPREPLPARDALLGAQPAADRSGPVRQDLGPASGRRPGPQESAHGLTRTALCVEVRDPRRANGPRAEAVGSASGVLYVFMPPLQRLEDYLALLAAVEDTAAALEMRIVIEGYPPPRDPRLQLLQVTPDPGVIEVNIHPVRHWDELVRNTEFLYQAAFESRLSAEKFMTDGRHTGTGGGNHFVLGGATPADSPFLRRPDLLASLLLYWHNHPSLSYLFSGLFIGPTSQSPRVDEARNDQLYEFDIALQQIQRQSEAAARREGSGAVGAAMPPWLLDRTLRNILVDVTGNTHRSEFSIDKMFSPDSATGRLGLLELRAFEMPPHARMSIVQQLLLRALVARFWRTPYRAPATRWGTELHDRFLLPTFVAMDFADVLTELREAGFAFEDRWFAPHLEFRFPRVGELHAAGLSLTLRHALEPWHVMGEESTGGGTARYVDSSLERIEVRVSGLNPSRYTVTCNGRPVPLQPTGTTGDFVAGVRYKAWNPPSSLHPYIGVHAPLTFDVVDTWMGRSVAGCRYHVSHPGGRNYATLPVNAFEAESRRLARFAAMGHTPGRIEVPAPTAHLAASREFPYTLDLRRG